METNQNQIAGLDTQRLKLLALELLGKSDLKSLRKIAVKIIIARCARVSYFNFDGKDDYKKDIETCDKLFGSIPRHLSPTEHVAQALGSSKKIGNFTGWKQYRYIYPDQNLEDSRIARK